MTTVSDFSPFQGSATGDRANEDPTSKETTLHHPADYRRRRII